MHTGTNLPRVRDYNQGVVLEAIRVAGGVSRVELAQRTGLTAQTVSNIVKRLLTQGLIVEAGRSLSNGGKPRVSLRINPKAGYAIGVQIDRDETTLVMLDLDGQVIVETRSPTLQAQGPQGVVAQIGQSVRQLLHETGVGPEKVLGIGVACPGPLDHLNGVVYNPPHLLGWEQVPLKAMMAQETGFAVIVDNDATVAAIGERWVGGAQGARNFAFVYLGMGIGAGLFIEDRVYRGSTSNAGEFGHTSIDPAGPLCFCGNRGCVEVLCAPNSVVAAVEQRLRAEESSTLRALDVVSYQAICQAAQAGDSLALEELQRVARLFGHAVVNLVTLLDIELVVLGGKALCESAALYQEEVCAALSSKLFGRSWRSVRVELSRAGGDAAAVGAAALVLYEFYLPQLRAL